MGAGPLTPEQARAAIAEATAARAPMRGSDRVFAVRLFALAAATVGLAALLALFGLLPPWMGPIEGLLAGVGLGGAVVLVLAAQTRQRAQTREGKRIFLTTVVIWVVWAEVVQEFSFRSDWMFHGLPQVVRGGHLLVSALIAVVPLLIGALMLGRRR